MLTAIAFIIIFTSGLLESAGGWLLWRQADELGLPILMLGVAHLLCYLILICTYEPWIWFSF